MLNFKYPNTLDKIAEIAVAREVTFPALSRGSICLCPMSSNEAQGPWGNS